MYARAATFAGLLLASGAVRAAEQLPIIVTYEMQRQREATAAARVDPKAFWVHQIVARIEAKTAPVPLGLARSATVRLRFVVERDGRLAHRTVEASSGIPAVDGEALAMLDRAQPFPPMPSAVPDDGLTFDLPLRFR